MKLNNTIKSTIRIAKIELNSMFYSPVSWLVILIFACQFGYAFAEKMSSIMHYQDLGQGLWAITSSTFTGMYGIFLPVLKTLYFYIPLITMGLMSREYQSGSIKLLYSSPIKNSSIILGKFLSMMVYGVVFLGIVIMTALFGELFIKDFDLPLVLSGLLGFYLLILAYSAIGIFMSSITHYQVVAAIGTLALLAFLNIIGGVGQDIDFVRDLTYWLSISDRSYGFLEGMISSEEVIYFIIVIAFFLLLSIFKINTEKTIMSLSKKIMGYSAIVLGTIVLGYATSRPQTKFYYDATQDKENTLSIESQQIVKDLKKQQGDIKITSYVNILAENYYAGVPKNRIRDQKRFEKYYRFMPGIEMEYVLYYDETNDPSYTAERFKGESLEETAKMVCKSDQLDFDKILSPEEFKEQYMDLSSEGHRLIRVVETKDGQKATLRMFNDNETHPSEAEISAALRRFIAKSPQVAFYTTNPARETDNYGDKGFYLFAHDKWYRNSLMNQGFDVKQVNLDSESLEGVDVLVISDLKQPLTEVAYTKIAQFVANGGSMFVNGDYQREDNMNRLSELLGVKFSDGVLVSENEYNHPTIVSAKFTEEAALTSPTFERLKRYGYEISAKDATSLDYSVAATKGFKVTPILRTTDKSWLDYNTTDFVDGVFTCDSALNESKGVRDVLVNLEREVGGKTQRIVVSGDADIISNGELTVQHPGMSASNFSIITGSFRWLSGDIYPVDTRHPDKTDDAIYLPKGSRKFVKGFFVGLIPLGLIVTALLLIIRRQRK